MTPRCSEEGALAAHLKRLASEYAATREGEWLTSIGYKDAPIEFVPRDLHGSYFLGSIRLSAHFVTDTVFPSYIHALRHMWQWKKHPLFYLAGLVIRPVIEEDASYQEVCAEDWLLHRKAVMRQREKEKI